MKNNYLPDARYGADYHNTSAPTLPLHSPHSPINLSTQQQQMQFHQSKLSARYIENKISTDNNTTTTATTTRTTIATSTSAIATSKAENTNSHDQQTTANTANAFKQTSHAKTSSSPHQLKKEVNPSFTHMIRPITTRNAATSPVLDMRKLAKFATLSPRNFTKTNNRLDHGTATDPALSFKVAEAKTPVEKSPSLDNTKPQKPLRSTRSLSPRPLIKQSQAIIISDEKDIISLTQLTTRPPTKFSAALSPLDIRAEKQQHQHQQRSQSSERRAILSCKSEQNSPSCMDFKDLKFSFNRIANRSTDCLTTQNDPWLKIGDSMNDKNRSIELYPQHLEHRGEQAKLLINAKNNSSNYLSEDPWIKRIDIKSPKQLKKDLLYQSKSMSVAGSGIDSKKNLNRPMLQRCKPPAMLDNILPTNTPMQSAPASPHVLQTPRNPFCSALSLTHQLSSEQLTAQTRSSSFSPARVKDSTNPFLKYDSSALLAGTSTPSPTQNKTAGAASASTPQWQQQKANVEMQALLAVRDPHLPDSGRHSISAASSTLHDKDDELPLSIRRLSDQIFRTSNVEEHVAIEAFKNRSSFGRTLQTKAAKMEIHKGADFSDYLNQFRSSEARKAAAAAAATTTTQSNQSTTTTIVSKKHLKLKNDAVAAAITGSAKMKTNHKDNTPLETTC